MLVAVGKKKIRVLHKMEGRSSPLSRTMSHSNTTERGEDSDETESTPAAAAAADGPTPEAGSWVRSIVESSLFEFLVGGFTVLIVTRLADMDHPFMVTIAALLSTLPVTDLLPIAFVSNADVTKELVLKNSVANAGVFVAMLSLYFILSSGAIAKGWSIGITIIIWLVVAGSAYAVMGAFRSASGSSIASE